MTDSISGGPQTSPQASTEASPRMKWRKASEVVFIETSGVPSTWRRGKRKPSQMVNIQGPPSLQSVNSTAIEADTSAARSGLKAKVGTVRIKKSVEAGASADVRGSLVAK